MDDLAAEKVADGPVDPVAEDLVGGPEDNGAVARDVEESEARKRIEDEL